MTRAVDQKTYWGLLETVRWICTRDEDRVAAMWDMSEEDGIAPAMFGGVKPQLDLSSLLRLAGTNFDADGKAAVPEGARESSRIDGPIMMLPSQALDDLLRKVHSRRVQMIAIRCHGSSDKQTEVSPVGLNDLIFHLVPDHPVARVGFWSRSRRNTLVWRSPQFLRADVIRVWPARNTKTAAVCGAILRHLREIMTPEAALTKLEARRRCLADVLNAYPAAFEKAWAELEPSLKRRRGKHGPRGH